MSPAVRKKRAYDTESEAGCLQQWVWWRAGEVNVSQLSQNKAYTVHRYHFQRPRFPKDFLLILATTPTLYSYINRELQNSILQG